MTCPHIASIAVQAVKRFQKRMELVKIQVILKPPALAL